jgi:hypothetical protein
MSRDSFGVKKKNFIFHLKIKEILLHKKYANIPQRPLHLSLPKGQDE